MHIPTHKLKSHVDPCRYSDDSHCISHNWLWGWINYCCSISSLPVLESILHIKVKLFSLFFLYSSLFNFVKIWNSTLIRKLEFDEFSVFWLEQNQEIWSIHEMPPDTNSSNTNSIVDHIRTYWKLDYVFISWIWLAFHGDIQGNQQGRCSYLYEGEKMLHGNFVSCFT